jgi:hypothetical protein
MCSHPPPRPPHCSEQPRPGDGGVRADQARGAGLVHHPSGPQQHGHAPERVRQRPRGPAGAGHHADQRRVRAHHQAAGTGWQRNHPVRHPPPDRSAMAVCHTGVWRRRSNSPLLDNGLVINMVRACVPAGGRGGGATCLPGWPRCAGAGRAGGARLHCRARHRAPHHPHLRGAARGGGHGGRPRRVATGAELHLPHRFPQARDPTGRMNGRAAGAWGGGGGVGGGGG